MRHRDLLCRAVIRLIDSMLLYLYRWERSKTRFEIDGTYKWRDPKSGAWLMKETAARVIEDRLKNT